MTDSRSDNSLSSEDTRSDDMETGTRVHNIFLFFYLLPTRVSIESMIEQIVFEQLEDGDVIKRYLVSACHDDLRLTDCGVGPVSSA